MKKILVIGAGGGVGSTLVKRLKPVAADARFTLADINPDRIPPEFMDDRAVSRRVDLFEANALAALIKEHDTALHCAGPFIRTAATVANACAEHGKDYLDLCDDIEALKAILPLDEKARAAGSRMVIGAGVSPGFTNVFAADLISKFEKVDILDVAWLSGDEGGEPLGEAVLEHVLHIAGGAGVRWRNGAPETFESYTVPSRFPMGGGMGARTLFEIAHPEPLMLGRTFPEIPLIRCFGGIDPPAIGAVVKGIARAAGLNKISRDEALRFMKAASVGKLKAPGVWIHALKGITGGLGDRMIGAADVLSFASWLIGGHQKFAGGVLCRATGTVDGRRASLVLRSKSSGPGTFINSMANATGTCAAAFSLVLLEHGVEPGIRFPEEMKPGDVYGAIGKLGFSPDDMIDKVFEDTSC